MVHVDKCQVVSFSFRPTSCVSTHAPFLTDSAHRLRKRKTIATKYTMWQAAFPLSLLRLLRAWNQTGQKHAGEPDIARHVLPLYPIFLWLLVAAEFYWVGEQIYRTLQPQAPPPICAGVSVGLCLSGLGFKLAFTRADAPELLQGLRWTKRLFPSFTMSMQDTGLVTQARATFVGVGVVGGMTIINGARAGKGSRIGE